MPPRPPRRRVPCHCNRCQGLLVYDWSERRHRERPRHQPVVPPLPGPSAFPTIPSAHPSPSPASRPQYHGADWGLAGDRADDDDDEDPDDGTQDDRGRQGDLEQEEDHENYDEYQQGDFDNGFHSDELDEDSDKYDEYIEHDKDRQDDGSNHEQDGDEGFQQDQPNPYDLMGGNHVYNRPPAAVASTPELLAALGRIPLDARRFAHHELPVAERMAYTQAAITSVRGVSKTEVISSLSYGQTLSATLRGPVAPNMTLDPYKAFHRLGINADSVLRQYAVCQKVDCCFLVPLEKLDAYDDREGHQRENGEKCHGQMFKMFGKVRKAVKILAFTPPSVMLQSFLRDPHFVRAIQEWRGDDEPPTDGVPTDRPLDRNHRMYSVHDGRMWRARDVNWRREPTDGRLRDRSVAAPQMLVGLEFGLLGAVNIDWFPVKDATHCSIGAVYLTILNLPRAMVNRQEWTTLALVIPGPSEPQGTALNRILEPLVEDLLSLENGRLFHIAGRPQPSLVFLQVLYSPGDITAQRELSASFGLSAGQVCNHCTIRREELQSDKAYEWRRFAHRHPQLLLNAAFRHRWADAGRRPQIERQHSVRWSEMARLSSFYHSAFCPPDLMHITLLGMTRNLLSWLYSSQVLVERYRDRWRVDTLNQSISKVTWPSYVGRLPPHVVSQAFSGQGGGLKADQLDGLRTCLPIVLWLALRSEANNGIADSHDRNVDRLSIYNGVLEFCSGLRILFGQSISVSEAEEAQDCLARAANAFRHAGMPLTVDWHIALHYASAIEMFGPPNGFATWAFERHNDTLARTNYFKGDPVSVPPTAARRFIKSQLILSVLSNPPPDAQEYERKFYQDQLKRLRAIRERSEAVILEEQRAHISSHTISLPTDVGRRTNLHRWLDRDLYDVTLAHVDQTFAGVSSYREINARNPSLQADHHETFDSLNVNGYRFTAHAHRRSTRDSWAIAVDVDGYHWPCRLESVLRLDLPTALAVGEDDPRRFLVAVTFLDTAEGELVPWDRRSSLLGLYLLLPPAHPPTLSIIAATSLLEPVAVIDVDTVAGKRLVVMDSYKQGACWSISL